MTTFKNTTVEIMAAVKEFEKRATNLTRVKILVLRNYTLEPWTPFVKLEMFKRGLHAHVDYEDYGVVEQAFLDASLREKLNTYDIVVVSQVLDLFDLKSQDFGWTSRESIERLERLMQSAEGLSPVFIWNTFLPKINTTVGITPLLASRNPSREIEKVNLAMAEKVSQSAGKFVLVDFSRIMALHGYENSLDQRNWFMSKAPFKKHFYFSYAQEVAAVASALKGKAKKVLVLDCDNTLWGGIVGEDGLDGIKLDPHSYPGNVFYEMQRHVLALQERGVMIALVSKNNEQDVFEVLDKHPSCLIKKTHLAGWMINWDDKLSNLKSLAEELNVGLDSFVFVDDNPVECGLIREHLNSVHVLQVPEKIYEYPDIILKENLFDNLTFSEEDKKRSLMYQQESLRKSDKKKFENIVEYWTSLKMKLSVREVQEKDIPRIAQLTQKTNQFNLTTLRLSEEDVRTRVHSSEYCVISMSVSDKYGDAGLTGAIFLKKNGDAAEVENFLMSCRILGRNLEYCFIKRSLNHVINLWRTTKIQSQYLKTDKNAQVSEFWDTFGMEVRFRGDQKSYEIFAENLRYPQVDFIEVIEDWAG